MKINADNPNLDINKINEESKPKKEVKPQMFRVINNAILNGKDIKDLIPVVHVMDGKHFEKYYTKEEFRELQKKWAETDRELKQEFIEQTNVYVSDNYFTCCLRDEMIDNYENLAEYCKKWLDEQFERDNIESVFNGKNQNCGIYVVLEDAVSKGWIPDTAFYDDVHRNKLSIHSILQAIEEERNNLQSKYFALSECVADIHKIPSEINIAFALKLADKDALRNNDIDNNGNPIE